MQAGSQWHDLSGRLLSIAHRKSGKADKKVPEDEGESLDDSEAGGEEEEDEEEGSKHEDGNSNDAGSWLVDDEDDEGNKLKDGEVHVSMQSCSARLCLTSMHALSGPSDKMRQKPLARV